MRLPPPFRAHGDHVAIDLPGARALFTTRRGGVSEGPYATLNLGERTDDDPERVSENRARVAEVVEASRGESGPREPISFAQGRQVHGTEVRRVTERPRAGEPRVPADGQATALPGVAPIVLVADCLPIALAAPGAVAMVHAGWRGLAGGVVEEGVAAVRELAGDAALAAAIGPCAGGCCYEVGEELHAAFGGEGRRGDNLDLKAIARRRLQDAGVVEVHDAEMCTICADPGLFFSHRRDGGVTGRQTGIVWRT